MKTYNLLAGIIITACLASEAASREWTDSTGKYATEADLVAFNDKLVVLKKKDSQLVAIHLDALSKQDQEYLQSKEAVEAVRKPANQYHTWTLQNGLKVVGRVVDYGRKKVTIERRRGKIYVNDRLFDNLPDAYRRMVPQIVAYFKKINIPDQKAFETWVRKQWGSVHAFTCEGVVLELENGDEYGVPFFFFSKDDLNVLYPGWERWVVKEKDKELKEHEAFLLESQAHAYQQDRKNTQPIALVQLPMQAYDAGMFDLWEVQLLPGKNVNGLPLVVVVPSGDNRSAAQEAVKGNPGYVVGTVVKVKRR